jgi:hypothetical protein
LEKVVAIETSENPALAKKMLKSNKDELIAFDCNEDPFHPIAPQPPYPFFTDFHDRQLQVLPACTVQENGKDQQSSSCWKI